MKKLLLLLLPGVAFADTTENPLDFVLSQKKPGAGYQTLFLAPAANSIWAFDASGIPVTTPVSGFQPTMALASQAEAIAGVDNTKWMSPLRVKQALDSLPGGGGTWGTIGGTLSDQTDLQTALDARSPLIGSASITTLGTISAGTWNGGLIPVAYGGTGTNSGNITGTGALTFTAGGTNQNLTLAGSGTGIVTTASRLTNTNATASSSTSTGAVVVSGGLGVGGALYAASIQSQGNLTFNNSGQLQFGVSGPYLTATGSNEIVFNNAGGSIRAPIRVSGFSTATTAVSANITLGAFDQTALVTTTTGAITVTLPAASSHPGRVYVVKKVSNDANNVVIGGTVDGMLNYAFNGQYIAITVQSNGTVWYIIDLYQP